MIEKRDIFFPPAGKLRRLHIHLPEDYYETDRRYPVMYFFDGHNLFSDSDATFGKSWGLEDFLQAWEKPILIVSIECGHEPGERIAEYCPYKMDETCYLGPIDGYGDATAAWMARELKPMIDQEYRTYPHREATGIGGSSMGGLMSLYSVIAHNDVYSKAACLSSVIFAPLLQAAQDLPLHLDTRVYLSWGTEESRATGRLSQQMEAILQTKGILTRAYAQAGGEHCEGDWEKQNGLYMDYLWLDR